MSFLDKLKDIYKQVSEVESTIYSGKQDYLEIYERNLQLEREIKERTHELNIANKRMLTLQHIWDMMNASRPLQSVLETIVNNIQGELGYLHCNIIKKCYLFYLLYLKHLRFHIFLRLRFLNNQ